MSFLGVCHILCVCPSFPFDIESGMWDVIVLIPDHCLSIYFSNSTCVSLIAMYHMNFKDINST